jgi:uncharacterized lipoprotein YbaY
MAGASVSGTIEFQGVSEPSSDVTVHVRVQDTSRADAKALTVAEQVIRNVKIVPGGPALPFRVDGIPENPATNYTLRVHADVSGDGLVNKGDYVSMQSVPVKSSGGQGLTVVARRVP